MEVPSALLCDFASVREGLLFVIGGGVSRLFRPTYPGSLGVSIAFIVDLDPGDIGVPHQISVRIRDEDGREVGRVLGAFNVPEAPDREPGETLHVPLAIDLRPIPLPATGAYTAAIDVDGDERKSLSFVARTGVPPGVTPLT
jgi:hypothetical protein